MESSTSLRAGVARADITPPVGAILVGFSDPERRATHVRDPLYATALVLDDGQTRAAIISCDLIYVHPSVARSVGALVQVQTGIASDRVLICGSHTHSGPAACDHPGAQPIDRSYVAILPFLLAGAVVEAAAQLEPVRLRWGTARSAVAVNRRERRADGRVVLGHNPSGPVDQLVRVACLDQLESGPPLALLVNYACHPVTLGDRSKAVSADYVGHTRTVVERATGSTMLFLQGACGDINPRFGPGVDDGSVQILGIELAGAVLAAAKETGGQDAGVVQYEAVFGFQIGRKIAELAIFPPAGGAINYEHPRPVAAGQRFLSDEIVGEMVVEVGKKHVSPL